MGLTIPYTVNMMKVEGVVVVIVAAAGAALELLEAA